MRLLICAAFFFGLTANAGAQPSCVPSVLEVQGGRVHVTYDPFLNQDTTTPVSLDMQIGDCEDTFLNFDIVAANNPAAIGTRGYELNADTRIDFIDPQGRSYSRWALPAERARNRSGGRAPLTDAFRVLVRRGQAGPPGIYEQQFLLRTLDGDGVTQAERPFVLTVETLASVRVGSPTRLIDFGVLEAGETARLPMNTFGNVAYQMRVQSERGWRLRSDDTPGEGVPYSVWLQNRQLNDETASVAIEPGPSGFRPLELGIRVEPFTTQPAGLYRDYITIQITPLS